jgi:hypothetical protein
MYFWFATRSRRIRRVGHVVGMRETGYAYTTLVGKPAGKKPPGIHRYRWEDNTKMDCQETDWDGAGWLQVGDK